MSKGSAPRPFQVANEQYAQRWDLIFGRDNEKKNKQENLDADQSSTSRHIGGGDHRNQSVGQVTGEGACGN
tara:strand:+ start:475 stop:687 length:213 start_codon:yes stop_codon:yes gene_type:complete